MCQQTFDIQFSKKVSGKVLEFVYKEFENKIFLIVTEFKNICNLYTVIFDANTNTVNSGVFKTPITISHNFGADTDECRSVIEFLVNKTKLKNSEKEILFNIGLKDVNGLILREISEIIDNFIK